MRCKMSDVKTTVVDNLAFDFGWAPLRRFTRRSNGSDPQSATFLRYDTCVIRSSILESFSSAELPVSEALVIAAQMTVITKTPMIKQRAGSTTLSRFLLVSHLLHSPLWIRWRHQSVRRSAWMTEGTGVAEEARVGCDSLWRCW